jgi:hypothetical protein
MVLACVADLSACADPGSDRALSAGRWSLSGEPGAWVGCENDADCAGGACIDGACSEASAAEAPEALGPAIGPLAAVVDPPVQVSGGTPSTGCLLQNEFYPERPWVQTGEAKIYAGYQSWQHAFSHNWASEWNAWDTTIHLPQPPGVNWLAHGDAFATTGRNALNYESSILSDEFGRACVGVGAATTGNLDGLGWNYPLTCANPLDPDFDDGPAMFMDRFGGTFQHRLWIVATELNTGGTPQCTGAPQGADPQVCLYIYNSCTSSPGFGGCALTSTRFVTSDIIDHATVTVVTVQGWG